MTRDHRFARAVREATGGRGADVIFDGLGRADAEENLEALALCGHWVSYGEVTGPLQAIAAERLTDKSATLTRPVLLHYTAQRAALAEIAGRAFTALRDGVLHVDGAIAIHSPPPRRHTVTSRPVGRRGPILLLP